MARGLLIAEKPDLMRSMQRGYNTVVGDLDYSLDFASLVGYLVELKYPKEYKEEWEIWNLDQLPIIPDNFEFKVKSNHTKTFADLKKKIEQGNYDFVLNACDAGREGQSIFWSVYNLMGCTLPVKRIWIQDTTEEAIGKGLKNLRDEQTDKELINIKNAAFLRMELDWLIGMNLSRALSLKAGATIPVGRVMTPTLNMIVQRDLEIENFVPKTTYEVDANFDNKYIGTWFDEETRETRFESEEKANKFISSLGKTGIVKEVETKRKTNWAPANYSLNDLQKDANNSYGFTAQQTLDLAQSLYETHQILSYPRTESSALSTAMGKELKDHLGALKEIEDVKDYVSEILKSEDKINRVRNSKRYVDDSKLTDHHAIIPTKKKPNLNILSANEKKLYLMVVKRFVATFLDPFLQDQTTVITKVSDESFRTSGSVLVDLGYKKLYDFKKQDSDIPKVNKGDTFNVVEFTLQEKISTPPPYYNDGTLIDAMEKAGKFLDEEDTELIAALKDGGIGTGATRAGIIEKLLRDELLCRKGKSLRSTDFGRQSISLIADRTVASPELTAEWEVKLSNIEKGQYDHLQFKQEMLEFVKEQTDDIIENVSANLGQSNEFEVIGSCPICGKDVIMSKKYYLCTDYKGKDSEEKGCSFILGQKILSANISKTNAIKILNGEKTDFINFKNKDGKKFKAKLEFDKTQQNVQFSNGDEVGVCPMCGEKILDRGNFYGCSGFQSKGCKFGIGKTIMGAKITPEHVEQLLNGEVIGPLKFTWKSGKKSDAKLKFNKDKSNLEFVFKEPEKIGTCPVCQNNVMDHGKWVQCSSCDFSLGKEISGAKINDDNIQKLINGQETTELNFTWASGKKGKAKLKYNATDKKLEFIFKNSNSVAKKLDNCPYCDGDIIDYGSFVKCNNKECNFSLSRKILGATVTNEDMLEMFKGNPSSVKNITYKDGNTDKKRLQLTKDKKLNFIN